MSIRGVWKEQSKMKDIYPNIDMIKTGQKIKEFIKNAEYSVKDIQRLQDWKMSSRGELLLRRKFSENWRNIH